MGNVLPAGTHPLPYVAAGMRVRLTRRCDIWTVAEVLGVTAILKRAYRVQAFPVKDVMAFYKLVDNFTPEAGP